MPKLLKHETFRHAYLLLTRMIAQFRRRLIRIPADYLGVITGPAPTGPRKARPDDRLRAETR